MDTPVDRVEQSEPIERFKPSTGAVGGWAGLLLATGVVIYVVLGDHSVNGLRIALAAAFAAIVVWVTQLRPRVTAYPGVLLMHGSLRDTYLPMALVDEVAMGQTLNVYVGRKRYVCVGIGRSVGYDIRQRVRSQGRSHDVFGSRAYQFTGRPETGGKERRTSYPAFVLDRLRDLVAAAKTDRDDLARDEVAHRYAVREIAGLVVTAVAFVLSLFL